MPRPITAATLLLTIALAACGTPVDQQAGSLPGTVDVVAIGASNVAGYNIDGREGEDPNAAFPGIYADRLAEEHGVQTALHTYAPDGERSLRRWNAVLSADSQLRSDLADAEVVILFVGFHDLMPVLLFGRCGDTWDTMQPCLEGIVAGMPEQYDTMLATITDLASEDTIIMIGDVGVAPMLLDAYAGQDYWPQLYDTAFLGWRRAIVDAADDHGVIVVPTAEALNGPEGTGIPPEEYDSGDGIHFSHAGHECLAELFLDADGIED
jgi:lysophospholipase L1-like esterase